MADTTADQVDFTADQVDLCLGDMVQDVAQDKVSAAEVRPHTGASLPPSQYSLSRTALLFRLLPPGPSQIPAQLNQRGTSQKTFLTSLLRPAQRGHSCSSNLHYKQAMFLKALLYLSQQSLIQPSQSRSSQQRKSPT